MIIGTQYGAQKIQAANNYYEQFQQFNELTGADALKLQ